MDYNTDRTTTSYIVSILSPIIIRGVCRMSDFYVFTCPHCQGSVIVQHNELNCRIFRHGIYKHNGEQMHPHTPREECDRLAQQGLIIGCGQPFRVDGDGAAAVAVVCDYV